MPIYIYIHTWKVYVTRNVNNFLAQRKRTQKSDSFFLHKINPNKNATQSPNFSTALIVLVNPHGNQTTKCYKVNPVKFYYINSNIRSNFILRITL